MEATAVALGEITKAKQSNAMILRPGETIVSASMNAPKAKAEKSAPRTEEKKEEASSGGIGAGLRALREEVQAKMSKDDGATDKWAVGDTGYFLQGEEQVAFEVMAVSTDPSGGSHLTLQYNWAGEAMVMDVEAGDPGLFRY